MHSYIPPFFFDLGNRLLVKDFPFFFLVENCVLFFFRQSAADI